MANWVKSGLGVTATLIFSGLAGCQGLSGGAGDENDTGSGESGSDETGGTETGAGNSPGDTGDDVEATDPGRVTLHRLNNTEYENTLRDLLGVKSQPASALPLDGSGAGFDNIADVLSLSEPHLVAYSAATENVVSEVLSSPELRSALIPCDLEGESVGCVKTVLRQLAPRAFRHPVNDAELGGLFAAAEAALSAGDTPEDALSLVLSAVLLSPHFLFRVELDAEPTSLEPHPLDDFELASRLSYFLWSSMPDRELFALAEAGVLHELDTLRAQVARMLADEKARALVENFAGQWLYLRKVDEVAPDASTFPGFDADLASAMKTETEMLFSDVVFSKLPASQLLAADFTYVNDRLAQHYGLPAVGTSDFVRVELPEAGTRAGGVFGHASVLTVTSHASTTSPVLRGKWVMNQLLCIEVPPPPPDVNTNLNGEGVTGATLRERLAQHREDAVCASCHELMDPIGLGLENYDAVGAYRATDEGVAIDPAGVLPDGRTFNGPGDLRKLVVDDPGFTRCMLENLYTYALGRVPDESPGHLDTKTLDVLDARFRENFDFSTLVTSIVESPTFLNRRGDPTTEADL